MFKRIRNLFNTFTAPVAVEEFMEWRRPIRGNANPEYMTNKVWSWLINSEEWPHCAHEILGLKKDESPIWCFDRFGQSETQLSDGTIIYIAGEHEDFYDEDFYIYNDVIIKHPNGSITIYGYPINIFPPTDFHTATVINDKIYIIGGLGYAEQNDHKVTTVYILYLNNYSILKLDTYGEIPPHLFKHKAEYIEKDNIIICESGEIFNSDKDDFAENKTIWHLDLNNAHWHKLKG